MTYRPFPADQGPDTEPGTTTADTDANGTPAGRPTQPQAPAYAAVRPLDGHVLPPGTRPTADDFPALDEPAVIWEDARWWRFTERTDLHEVRYLSVDEGGRTVALAPLLLTREAGGLLFYDPPRLIGTAGSMAEPDILDPADQERWSELGTALPLARPDQYPSLTLGVFGSHHGVAHATDRSPAQRAAVMAALPGLLRRAAADLGCRSSALLYVGEPEAAAVDSAARRSGYQAVLLGAEGVQHLPETDWDGYLTGLGSHRRRRICKEVDGYRQAGWRTVARSGPDALDDEVVALQVAHRAKYGLPGGEDRVRRDFDAVSADLGDSCLVLGSEREGRLGGFVLYFRAGDALFARTAGFSPEAKGCYLALTYHETVRWALDHGIRRIHYGLSAYQAKFARGCELQPRWGWFAFEGPHAGVYRDAADLQSRSIERRLASVGAPVVPLASLSSRRSTTPPSVTPSQGAEKCS
ncbi:GNAT family N-acetyltransferase [Streptomyces griseoluteus]|uniref:GNAT family N-acetyltransferase n=1 Tax=Streptomyces griseoluteus TaxID=29306 RepID=UPI003804BD99